MFREVFKFECRYQLRSALFPIIAIAFLLIGYLAMASDQVTVGVGDSGSLKLNASFVIIVSAYVFSIVAMLAGVAFVAAPIPRGRGLRTALRLVSTGVAKRGFLI